MAAFVAAAPAAAAAASPRSPTAPPTAPALPCALGWRSVGAAQTTATGGGWAPLLAAAGAVAAGGVGVGFGRRTASGDRIGRASGSDSLLYESLNREAKKLSSGVKRSVDAAAQAPTRTPSYAATSVSARSSSGRVGFSLASLGPRFSGSGPSAPVMARLLAMACLVPALVAAVPYGIEFFTRSQWLRQTVLVPLLPLIKFYHASPINNYLTIAALYGLVAKNRSLHPFTRSVGAQTSTLMMVQFPANFILQFFAAAPGPLANLARGSVFAFYVYCLSMCLLGCLMGRQVHLAGIGDGDLSALGRRAGSMSGLSRGGGFPRGGGGGGS